MSTCDAVGFATFFTQALGASGATTILNGSGVSDFLNFLSDATFYCSIRNFILDEIVFGPYKEHVSSRLASVIAYLSSVIFTIWVAYQGYSIILAQNKQPILATLQKGAKIVLVMSLVSFLAKGSPVIAENVFAFKDVISYSVVGYKDEDKTIGLRELIDINLAMTSQLGKITDSMASAENGEDKKNKTSTGLGMLGQAGPAILTAILMMLAELSITFAVMLSPLFIFFLLFQQTSALFWSWTKFIIGAFFSMAVLTVVATLALKSTAIYGMSVLITYYLTSILPAGNNGSIVSVISSAVAGVDIAGSFTRLTTLGFLMSALIVGVPAMVMQFFNAGAAFASGAMNAMYGLGSGVGRTGMGTGGRGMPGMRFNANTQQNLPAQQEPPENERTDTYSAGTGISFPAQIGQRPKSASFQGNARPSYDYSDNDQYGDGTVLDYRNDHRGAIGNFSESNSVIANPFSGGRNDAYALNSSDKNNQLYMASANSPVAIFPGVSRAPEMSGSSSTSMHQLSQSSGDGLEISSRPSLPWEESRSRNV